ncbi:hypothetical protein IPM09_05300 [Candidatus Saccharibacteria bacterium]|nr:MAG: hypothetical protein IPM09_05300 [Candidatus Saccharibacteria bacterium]
MKYSLSIITTLIAGFTVTLFTTALVSAVDPPANNQQGLALEIAPPVLNFVVDPGETIKSEIAIRDVSNSALFVTSEINDFTASGDESGNPRVITDDAEPSPYSLIPWVSKFPNLTLKPKQLEKLPLEIKVPANAAPGGYYGVVRFTASAPAGTTSSVSLAPSLGALILIRVKGAATEKLTIAEFYMEKDDKKSTFFEEIPFNFVERVNNEGNVYEQPVGTILVKDMFGKPVVNINVNSEARNILPKSVRKFTQPLDKAALGTGFLFGRYTAELKLNYGDKLTTTQTLSFWVIPWRLILLILFLLTVAIIAIRAAILRYNERLLGRSRRSRRR